MKCNINAIESSVVFEHSFTDSKESEEEIDKRVFEFSEKGFEAVIITAVKSVEESNRDIIPMAITGGVLEYYYIFQ